MSKLPAVKPSRVIKALQRHGYYIHHVRGSHYFLRKSDRNVVIPYHSFNAAAAGKFSWTICRIPVPPSVYKVKEKS